MKTCILLVFCAIFLFGVQSYDNKHHDRDHGRHTRHYGSGERYGRNQGGYKKTFNVKSSVKFPSGESFRIVSPFTSSKRCPGRPKYVHLEPNSKTWKKEYNIVKKELDKALKVPATETLAMKNVKIEKVFNTCLWQKYKYRKDIIYAEAKKAAETMLFHAPTAPHKAAEKGLDERFSTLEKGKHGAGLYFSNNAYQIHTYAKQRPDGKRIIMLCRVVLGNVKVNAVSEVVKLAHPPIGFQSVASADGDTTEYTIYRGEQAFPDYLITYEV